VVIGQIQHRRHRAGDERAFAWLQKNLSSIRGYFMDWEYRDGWGYVAPVGL